MTNLLARFPLIMALLSQTLALLSVAVALHFGSGLGLRVSPLGLALGCGALAAGFSFLAGMERWWLLIQGLAPPAVWLLLRLQFSPWVYGMLFVALLSTYWSVFQTRVPLYLSGPKVWQALQPLLPEQPGSKVIDVGSGLGGLLLSLARARADLQFQGIELAPLPALISRWRVRRANLANCRIQWGSFWRVNLRDFDMVFAFLSPVPMPELWRKARAEMRPGTLFISSSFKVPGQSAQRIIKVHDRRGTELNVWSI